MIKKLLEQLTDFEQVTDGTIERGDFLVYPDGTLRQAEITIGNSIRNYASFFSVARQKERL